MKTISVWSNNNFECSNMTRDFCDNNDTTFLIIFTEISVTIMDGILKEKLAVAILTLGSYQIFGYFNIYI